jgi:hypothetical protein
MKDPVQTDTSSKDELESSIRAGGDPVPVSRLSHAIDRRTRTAVSSPAGHEPYG